MVFLVLTYTLYGFHAKSHENRIKSFKAVKHMACMTDMKSFSLQPIAILYNLRKYACDYK